MNPFPSSSNLPFPAGAASTAKGEDELFRSVFLAGNGKGDASGTSIFVSVIPGWIYGATVWGTSRFCNGFVLEEFVFVAEAEKMGEFAFFPKEKAFAMGFVISVSAGLK
ncbi:MAG: hypothetical protein V1706_11580 [Pseudomonadota bacterium]